MKKFLSVFLVMLIIVSAMPMAVFAVTDVAGDVDGDGKVTSADARFVLRNAVGLEVFTKKQIRLADVDGNKGITSADARLVLRAAVGLEKLSISDKIVYGDTTFENIKVGTGSTTGTYYALATASLQAITTSEYGFDVVSTGGSQANIEGIEDGDYHFATVQNDVMNYAYKGMYGFTAPITSFSAVACIYPEVVQLVATASSGIKSVEDLKGKKVGIGDVGTGTYYNAMQILEAAGLDARKDVKTTFCSFGDAAWDLKNGYIDAAFVTAGTPTTSITELATSTDVVIVDLGEKVINSLIEEYPFYTLYEVTEDDYSFVKKPVNTVAIMATYVVTNEMSEDQVYKITKALWENKDVKTCHSKAYMMDIKTTLDGLGYVPLHPGAKKYYKEAGIIK